jgi:hypothetical protein
MQPLAHGEHKALADSLDEVSLQSCRDALDLRLAGYRTNFRSIGRDT